MSETRPTRQKEIPDVTESERESIYNQFEEFMQSGGSCDANQRLHLPGGEESVPMCDGGYGEPAFEWVPVAVWPPGYRPICRFCVAEWRRSR